jgi:DNA-binding NarL/FixJ family response regulator
MPNQTAARRQQRQGDIQAMLRLMQPLDGATTHDPPTRKRRLLADLCRLIGDEVNGNGNAAGNAKSNGDEHAWRPSDRLIALETRGLSQRLEQTLRSLLDGDSEKQVAAKLGLSQHTVHVYVKALYKKFGVSSRGELLARLLKR